MIAAPINTAFIGLLGEQSSGFVSAEILSVANQTSTATHSFNVRFEVQQAGEPSQFVVFILDASGATVAVGSIVSLDAVTVLDCTADGPIADGVFTPKVVRGSRPPFIGTPFDYSSTSSLAPSALSVNFAQFAPQNMGGYYVAAVVFDLYISAAEIGDFTIRVYSEGWPIFTQSLSGGSVEYSAGQSQRIGTSLMPDFPRPASGMFEFTAQRAGEVELRGYFFPVSWY